MDYFFDLQKAMSDERMAKTRFYRECWSGFRSWRGARRGFAGNAGRGWVRAPPFLFIFAKWKNFKSGREISGWPYTASNRYLMADDDARAGCRQGGGRGLAARDRGRGGAGNRGAARGGDDDGNSQTRTKRCARRVDPSTVDHHASRGED